MTAHILMVEDETAIANQLSQFLVRRGYRVTPACDGNEAIAQLGKATFDLIITDIRMPGLDGRGLLERLRHTSDSPPIIVVTGQIDYDPGDDNGAGRPTVLRKPVSLRELDKTIRTILCDPVIEDADNEQ